MDLDDNFTYAESIYSSPKSTSSELSSINFNAYAANCANFTNFSSYNNYSNFHNYSNFPNYSSYLTSAIPNSGQSQQNLSSVQEFSKENLDSGKMSTSSNFDKNQNQSSTVEQNLTTDMSPNLLQNNNFNSFLRLSASRESSLCPSPNEKKNKTEPVLKMKDKNNDENKENNTWNECDNQSEKLNFNNKNNSKDANGDQNYAKCGEDVKARINECTKILENSVNNLEKNVRITTFNSKGRSNYIESKVKEKDKMNGGIELKIPSTNKKTDPKNPESYALLNKEFLKNYQKFREMFISSVDKYKDDLSSYLNEYKMQINEKIDNIKSNVVFYGDKINKEEKNIDYIKGQITELYGYLAQFLNNVKNLNI